LLLSIIHIKYIGLKKLLIALSIILSGYFAVSQNLDIPAFGSDSTFEMMTWNIEHFPKNGQTTIDYVSEIILDLEIDLIAMQELEDFAVFNQMMTDIEGYDGYYKPSSYVSLAFIYNSQVIEIDTVYEIFTSQTYSRPLPRSPMIVELHFRGEKFIIINNHFKCCGDGNLNMSDDWDEEKRRLDASTLLKGYIDEYFEGEKVILTGDLNDLIEENTQNNVFNCFIDDPENYLFADMELAQGDQNQWSYPTWPSHLDHILITNELFEDFSMFGSEIITLRLDDYFSNWSQYDSKVSDHRPVAIKINSDSFLGEDEFIITNEFVNYPNPTSRSTIFSFNPIENKNTSISIFNTQGVIIESIKLSVNQTSCNWDASNFPSGIYLAQLVENKKIVAVRKVVVR